MTPERWRRIDALLESTLELPAEERPEFLEKACGSDLSLRREVEALMAAEPQEVQPREAELREAAAQEATRPSALPTSSGRYLSRGAESVDYLGAAIRVMMMTDLVDSPRLVESLGDRRFSLIARRHDGLARDLLSRYRGREIDKSDSFLLLFERPVDAVGYALAYHRALVRLSQEEGVELGARVGIHFGEVMLRSNEPEAVRRGAKPLEVEGQAKVIAARVMSLAGRRQTLLSHGAFHLARRAAAADDGELAAPELRWLAHGPYLFAGVEEPLEIFEVGVEGKAPLAPPAETSEVRRARKRRWWHWWR